MSQFEEESEEPEEEIYTDTGVLSIVLVFTDAKLRLEDCRDLFELLQGRELSFHQLDPNSIRFKMANAGELAKLLVGLSDTKTELSNYQPRFDFHGRPHDPVLVIHMEYV